MHELFYRTGRQGVAHVHLLEHHNLVFVHYLLFFSDGSTADGHFELPVNGDPKLTFENWRKRQPSPSGWAPLNQHEFSAVKKSWAGEKIAR